MKIIFETIDKITFTEFYKLKRPELFSQNFGFAAIQAMSIEEREFFKTYNASFQDMKELRWVAKYNDEIIGWSFGIQKSEEDFYMINSAVLPEYRNNGIYTKLLALTVEKCKEMGFQRIYSRHHMSNNAIIIPKLKYGFTITGFEIDDRFGTMAILSYYTNELRREMMSVRDGSVKVTERLKPFLV